MWDGKSWIKPGGSVGSRGTKRPLLQYRKGPPFHAGPRSKPRPRSSHHTALHYTTLHYVAYIPVGASAFRDILARTPSHFPVARSLIGPLPSPPFQPTLHRPAPVKPLSSLSTTVIVISTQAHFRVCCAGIISKYTTRVDRWCPARHREVNFNFWYQPRRIAIVTQTKMAYPLPSWSASVNPHLIIKRRSHPRLSRFTPPCRTPSLLLVYSCRSSPTHSCK